MSQTARTQTQQTKNRPVQRLTRQAKNIKAERAGTMLPAPGSENQQP